MYIEQEWLIPHMGKSENIECKNIVNLKIISYSHHADWSLEQIRKGAPIENGKCLQNSHKN